MFGLPPLLAHIAELISITLVALACTGAGLRLLALLRVAPLLSMGERLLFGMLLGYGLLSFSTLAIGLIGILYTWSALLLLVTLGIWGAGPLTSALRFAFPRLRAAITGLRHSPALAFLTVIIAVVIVATLVRALVPVATQDDLMYHLALPRRYVEDHAVRFYPDSNYSLFPQLMEMLYTVGLLLGSDRLSILFAFSTGLLASAAAALFAARFLSDHAPDRNPFWRAVPLLVGAIYLSSPLTGFVLRAGNTDFAQASAEMLMLYAFYLALWRKGEPNKPLLILAGICGGLSFSVKYYGVVAPALLGILLIIVLAARWWAGKQDGYDGIVKRILSNLPAFSLPAVSIAAVWLLRNFVSSGNPVWPAMGKLLGGSYWSPAADPEVLLGTVPGLSLSSLFSGLQYDLNAITRPPLPIDNHLFVVSVGPLLITALLALPLARWKPPLRLVFFIAASVWMLSLFYFSRASIRYLLTVFLLCAVLGGYSLISAAVRASKIAQTTIACAVGLSLLLPTLDAAINALNFLPTTVALNKQAETDYLAQHMEDFPITSFIAQNTPSNAVVYVWDSRPRGYQLSRAYIYGRLVPKYSGVSADTVSWHARLKELGVTHVLIHTRLILAPSYPPGFDPDRATEEALAARYFTPPLITSGDYVLYGLK